MAKLSLINRYGNFLGVLSFVFSVLFLILSIIGRGHILLVFSSLVIGLLSYKQSELGFLGAVISFIALLLFY